ncbi:MAG: hypothetical protein JKY30_07810 [Flavobacteriales bacterium]|nr:hypothetical protein [Flavobacteriales bacterium]
MLLLPKKELDNSFLSSIQFQLEELEGDYHTFFHEDNLQDLCNDGLISDELVVRVREIKNRIDNIDSLLWNPMDFINSEEWKEVRGIAVGILKEEIIK